MSFMNKVRSWLYKVMRGRYGADQLGFFLIWGAVIVSLLGSIFGLLALSLLSTAMWVFALFRILSKNHAARRKENDKFLAFWRPLSTNLKQAYTRFKNRKQFHYFRCPKCHAWHKVPRGVGQITMTCGKCGHQFDQKG